MRGDATRPIVVLAGLLAITVPTASEATECPVRDPRSTVVWHRFVDAAHELYRDAGENVKLTPKVMGHALGKAALQVEDDPGRQQAFACLELGVQQQIGSLAYVTRVPGLMPAAIERGWETAQEAAMGFHDDEVRRAFGVGPDDVLAPIFGPVDEAPTDTPATSVACRVVQESGNPNARHAEPGDNELHRALREAWTYLVNPQDEGGFTVHVVQQPGSHPDSLRLRAIRRRMTAWHRSRGAGIMSEMGVSAVTRAQATESAECFCARQRGERCANESTADAESGDEDGEADELIGVAPPAEPERADPAAAAAEITATTGDVLILDANGRERPGCVGCTIRPGETLVTGPSAEAKITWTQAWGFDFLPPAAFELAPGSQLEIVTVRHPRLPCHPDKGCPVYTVHGWSWSTDPAFAKVSRGRIRAVARLGSRRGGFSIRSGPATVRFEGTDFVVGRDSTGAVEVMVGDGAVTVETGGAPSRVAAGERLVIRDGTPGAVAPFAAGEYPGIPARSEAAATAPDPAGGGGSGGGPGGGSAAGGGGGGGGVRAPGFGLGEALLLGLGVVVLGLLVALVVVRSRATAPRRGSAGARIELTLDVHGPDGATRVVRFDRQPVRIGRDASNDLVLGDPAVSRRHAEIVVRDGQLRIVDRSSAAGVFVDGSRVEGAELVSGAKIRIGDTTVHVR